MFKRIFRYNKWALDEMLGKKSTKQIYDELASKNRYDIVIDYQKRLKGLKKTIKYLPNQKYQKVLDIACGTGVFIDALPDKENLDITGIDLSDGMLSIARERFKNYPNIKMKQIDIFEASFPQESFDLITISNSIRFMPQKKEKEIEEKVAGWLKKDGILLIVQGFFLYDKLIPPFITKIIYKGFNSNLRREENIKKLSGSFLVFNKEITIDRQYFIFKTRAYFFRKNRIKQL